MIRILIDILVYLFYLLGSVINKNHLNLLPKNIHPSSALCRLCHNIQMEVSGVTIGLWVINSSSSTISGKAILDTKANFLAGRLRFLVLTH